MYYMLNSCMIIPQFPISLLYPTPVSFHALHMRASFLESRTISRTCPFHFTCRVVAFVCHGFIRRNLRFHLSLTPLDDISKLPNYRFVRAGKAQLINRTGHKGRAWHKQRHFHQVRQSITLRVIQPLPQVRATCSREGLTSSFVLIMTDQDGEEGRVYVGQDLLSLFGLRNRQNELRQSPTSTGTYLSYIQDLPGTYDDHGT